MTKRDTRELILETSLKLFNELGEPHVTTNHIADEADISPGNLYYHFRHKQDIVLVLFQRFAMQLDPLLDVPASLSLEAEDLWFQLHLSFELKGHYRFLYRNFADLAGSIPNLDKAFRGLFLRERQAAANLISGLELRGVMQIGETEKDLLLDNLMLALIYWIPYSDVLDSQGRKEGQTQVRAIAGVLQMVTPYLARPERDHFAELTHHYLSHPD